MRNSSYILEIIWMIIGLLCIGAMISALKTGGNKIFIFALMAVIAFFFAWLRHTRRKNS